MSGVTCRQEKADRNHTTKEGPMTVTRSAYIFSIAAFLLGFGLGGVSLHVASAQGLFGLKASVSQIGTALIEMQKNVDALQKNMGTIKQAKDQLSSLSPAGSDAIKSKAESLKQLVPGLSQ
jgi:hypothetical protein